jgi:hypothetical protein
MPQVQPLYDPANGFTGVANSAITGGRLVAVAATKANGAPVKVAHASATVPAIGVAGADAAQDAVVTIYPRQVIEITSSAAITAGTAVEQAAAGKIATLATGLKVGVALTTVGAADLPVLVQLQL